MMTLYSSRNIIERRGRILKNEMGIINFNSLDVATIFFILLLNKSKFTRLSLWSQSAALEIDFFGNFIFMAFF